MKPFDPEAAAAALESAAAEPMELIGEHLRQACWRTRSIFEQLRRAEVLFDPALDLGRLLELSDLGGSRSPLQLGFEKVTGQTIWAYVVECRLETAAALLVESELMVGDVAHLTGFTSLEHLSTAFERWRGLRPSAFRESEAAGTTARPDLEALAREIWVEIRALPAEEQAAAVREDFTFVSEPTSATGTPGRTDCSGLFDYRSFLDSWQNSRVP